jgi:hypothetical protein
VNDRRTRYVARRESLIFCWQLSEPSSFRGFSRRFGRRPPAKNLAAFIEDFSLVSAAPKLNPVQPSPVDTRRLHLCHARCLTRRCDLTIAVPPGKLPQAARTGFTGWARSTFAASRHLPLVQLDGDPRQQQAMGLQKSRNNPEGCSSPVRRRRGEPAKRAGASCKYKTSRSGFSVGTEPSWQQRNSIEPRPQISTIAIR